MLALSKYFDGHRPAVLATVFIGLVVVAAVRIIMLSWRTRQNRGFDRIGVERDV